MARQKQIVAGAQQARGSGSEVRVLVDGPSPEHELVLQGRLEGQAPDIDPVVYLTDCDPSGLRAGAVHPARDRRRRGATTCSPRRRLTDAIGVRRRSRAADRVLYSWVAASREGLPSGPVPTFCVSGDAFTPRAERS